ncbi:putative alpha-glucosidase [Helianthus annuus]|nr:putative alpha-glucosidase [Helianthus annuus]KAJ0630402.1 putative alpha-glucosidase [Helianthus annuus]
MKYEYMIIVIVLFTKGDVSGNGVIILGTVFMPPKWSLGYQQCRWSYNSNARVREVR